MRFFSIDSPVYRFMSRFWDMIKLNFCWLICSLPIVTMGAATVAAYSVTLHMVDDSDGYVVRPFYKAFRDNLKQGSVMGLLGLVCAYAVYLDFQFFGALQGNPMIFLVIGLVGLFLFALCFVFAFPIMARYQNSIWRTLKNSYRIATRYFLRTLVLFVVLLIEAVIFMWNTTTLILGVLIGPACMILTISGCALFFFHQIEKETEEVK